MFRTQKMNRRDWIAGAGFGLLGSQILKAEEEKKFRLHYVLSSAMYGTLPLEQVLASVKKTVKSDLCLASG